MSIQNPASGWASVTAFWHTHGEAVPENRYFSDIDVGVVEQFGKPVYMADYTGVLKVFQPGGAVFSEADASRLGLPAIRSGYARGEFVRDRENRPIRVATNTSAG